MSAKLTARGGNSRRAKKSRVASLSFFCFSRGDRDAKRDKEKSRVSVDARPSRIARDISVDIFFTQILSRFRIFYFFRFLPNFLKSFWLLISINLVHYPIFNIDYYNIE